MDSSYNIQNYFKKGKTVVLTLRQGETDEVRQWSDKDTSQLLSLMNESLPDFQNHRRRKKEVWIEISNKLSNDGYCWTSEDCRKKWSNMVRTFKGIQEQKQDPSLSSRRIKWPFFEYMSQLLALDGADYLPESTSIIQLINNPIQAPSSPTAILSLKSNAREAGQSCSGTTIENTSSDMVSVVADADLASMMTGSSGDEVIILDPLKSSEIDQCQPSTISMERLIGDDQECGEGPNERETSYPPPPKPIVKSGKAKTKKRVRRKSNNSSENPESMMDKFISITSRQNEFLLEQLTTFQENALGLMQERNNILKRLCVALEHQSPTDGVSASTSTCSTSRRFTCQEADGSPRQESQNRTTTSYVIDASDNLTNISDSTNVGDLHDSIAAGSVTVEDSEALHTLISPTGEITFHLNTPDNPSMTSHNNPKRLITNQKGQIRLENMPSDVNISAFSGAMSPYYLSVASDSNSNSARKPRFIQNKSVTVPLIQGHRRIAPRKSDLNIL